MLEKNVELMGLHLIIFCLDSFIFKKLGSFCIGGQLIFFFFIIKLVQWEKKKIPVLKRRITYQYFKNLRLHIEIRSTVSDYF